MSDIESSILSVLRTREGEVQQVRVLQAHQRNKNRGTGRARSLPAGTARAAKPDCTRQEDLSSVRQSLCLIYVE